MFNALRSRSSPIVQPGKRADLLVLNANPLTDIKNTRQIHSVWIGGRRLASSSTN